jgi:hypothetical protein
MKIIYFTGSIKIHKSNDIYIYEAKLQILERQVYFSTNLIDYRLIKRSSLAEKEMILLPHCVPGSSGSPQ